MTLSPVVVGEARAWHLPRRVLDVVTPLGWTIAGAMPVALIAGYVLGWVELVVIGFALLLMVAAAAIYLLGGVPVAASIEIRRPRVVVGTDAPAVVVVRGASSHRGFSPIAEIPLGRERLRVAVPRLDRGQEFRQGFTVPTRRRGVLRLGPVHTLRTDPVGILQRELISADSQELFVHPRTIATPSTSSGLVRDLEGRATRDPANTDVAFFGLREYAVGDERRYIHWRSTAKAGAYMVRQFEESRRSRLVVALSVADADYASGEEFELAVSVAGSLGIRALRDARDMSVLVGTPLPGSADRSSRGIRPLRSYSRTGLLDDLSGVDRTTIALTMVDLARSVARISTDVSLAFLVCGSRPTPAELRTATRSFAPGVEVVVVVCDPEQTAGFRRAGGLSMLTLRVLEDLPATLARSVAV